MWPNTGLSIREHLLVGAIIVVLALWMDKWLGEPSRWHPLIGFGRWATYIEKQCRRMCFVNESQRGIFAWILAVVPLVMAMIVCTVVLAKVSIFIWCLFNVLILYLTLGGKSLIVHANNIFRPLKENDLALARRQVSLIVSRNTNKMTETDITSAAIESVLENGNDAVFAPMFWFVIFGAPGAVMFRLANTLDAMWGYKNEPYFYFGRFTAKMDDFLGWIPARVTALVYAFQGKFSTAIMCWRTQAKGCSSPNGGVVMTAGAGALGISIGGPTYYHGVLHDKKKMGFGPAARWPMIPLANQLVSRGSVVLSYLWLVFVFVGVR